MNKEKEFMGIIRFQVAGLMGQPRPRFSTANNKIRTYDQEKAVNYKEQVAFACILASNKKRIKIPIQATNKGIEVKILAVYKYPQSFSKAKLELAKKDEIKPTKKPDADNIAKIILDGLNNVLWHDDNQVTRLEIEKAYSDKEYVDIEVSWQ